MEAQKGPDIPEFDRLVLAVTNQVAPVPSWVQEGNSVNVTWNFLRNSRTEFKKYPAVSIFSNSDWTNWFTVLTSCEMCT